MKITLEEMEIMIDNAEKTPRPDPLLEAEAFNKDNKPSFKKEHANQSLTELLTVRELEVLTLIAAGLSNQEICDTLFFSAQHGKGL